jgi:hypothetical protein
LNTGSLRESLWRALPGILPNAEQTLLLRACLLEERESRTAWETWRAGVVDPIQALSDSARWARTLLPLLMTSISRSGAEVDAPTLSYLRAAFVREKLRIETYRSVRGQVLSSLTAQGVSTIVLKGAAFVDTIYDTPAHRHCHDIDLLVHPGGAARLRPIVAQLGFSAASSPEGPAHALFIHSSGLPLRAHTRPFLAKVYDARVEELFERSIDCMLDGTAARVLCPVDGLVHLCGHASSVPGVDAIRWVCDAARFIGCAPDLNWDEVPERARAMNVVVPLSVQLDYLAMELQARIPETVRERLRSAAGDAALPTIRAAFQGALLSGRSGLKRPMEAAGDWRVSALLAAWAVPAFITRTRRARGR